MVKELTVLNRLVAVALGATLLWVVPARGDQRIDLLTQYLDLVVSGNYQSARDLWTEADQERATRFGIEFVGVPVKIDCGSPIMQDLKVMRNYLQVPASQLTAMASGDFTRLNYSALVSGKKVEYAYWVYYDGTYFWLAFPQDYYCRDWPVQTSRYLRLHVALRVKTFLNPAVLREADAFIERTADSLGIAKAERKLMADQKIEYFFCDTDEQMRLITGQLIKGTYDLGPNDILSSFFPHYHELTHLLVNIKLRRLPLFTQPIMQEGLAVHFGGRWGKAPTALTGLGVFLLKEKMVYLDSLMTKSGFEAGAAADIAYPVAGLFASFLLEKMGIEKYLQLYLKLSGDLAAVSAMTAPDVETAIAAASGSPTWADLAAEFGAYMEKMTTTGADFLPGLAGEGRPVLKQDKYTVYDSKDWLAFEFKSDSGEVPAGSLLFGADKDLNNETPWLFEEQFQGKYPYDGRRYGLRFDKNEAGLYDYASNYLIAKYIYGLTPSDEYIKNPGNSIRIKFRKTLIGDQLPTEGKVLLLPI